MFGGSICTLLVFLVCIIQASAVPTARDNALCGLIAATQVFDSPRIPPALRPYQWQCTPAGITAFDPCNSTKFWTGITCRQGVLVDIDLSTFTIKGTIPPSIGELTTLTKLALSSNCMNGTLPSQLFNLRQLSLVSLNDRWLSYGSVLLTFVHGAL
jgi:hypothetical protein